MQYEVTKAIKINKAMYKRVTYKHTLKTTDNEDGCLLGCSAV
jgi:hypothetical protein